LNPFVVHANGAQLSTDTSILLQPGEGKFVRIGSALQTTTLSGQVNEQLDVIQVVGDTVTVNRGVGGTTAVAIGAGENLTIIGQPLEGNSDLQLDSTRARIGKSNFCQVVERSVDISRRQMKRGMVAVANEFAKSIKDRTFEAKRELELSLIFMRSKSSGTKDGDYSKMDGLISQLTAAGLPNSQFSSFVSDAAAAPLTEAYLNARVADLKSVGGKVNVVFTSEKQARVFSSASFFGGGSATGIRWQASDRVRGQYIRQYLSDSGWVLDILSNPFIRADILMLLQTDLISYHAFKESDWFMINAQTFRDGQASRLVGDYTCKVQHAGESHAIVRNLQ
jgi:hypothetical protein